MSHRPAPSEDRLLAFAAGTLSPPEAVVVAAHVAMRPDSAAWVRRLQSVGGTLMEDLAPASLADDALARALARVEVDTGEVVALAPLNDMPELPEPLRRYRLGRWRWAGPGVRVRDMETPRAGGVRNLLLRIDPGCSTPNHTHGGVELTCVISGAYETDEARFGPGDFEEADPEVRHRPRVISSEPCLCVAALDGQIILDGWMGKILQPLVRL